MPALLFSSASADNIKSAPPNITTILLNNDAAIESIDERSIVFICLFFFEIILNTKLDSLTAAVGKFKKKVIHANGINAIYTNQRSAASFREYIAIIGSINKKAHKMTGIIV